MVFDFYCILQTQDIGYLVDLLKTVSFGQDTSYEKEVQDFPLVTFFVIDLQLSTITVKGKMPEPVSKGLNNH